MFYVCFMMFYKRFMVFHDVLIRVFHIVLWCLVSNAMIGIADCVTANWCRDRRWRSQSDPMLNSVLNGHWSNSVPRRQFQKGVLGIDIDVLAECCLPVSLHQEPVSLLWALLSQLSLCRAPMLTSWVTVLMTLLHRMASVWVFHDISQCFTSFMMFY